MAAIAQKTGENFYCGPSNKTGKYQQEMETIERYIQSMKNIYKLKWLSPYVMPHFVIIALIFNA